MYTCTKLSLIEARKSILSCAYVALPRQRNESSFILLYTAAQFPFVQIWTAPRCN